MSKYRAKSIIFLSFLYLMSIFSSFKLNAMKDEKPSVSIIVPVYNVEPWIKECIDSLVNQTLKNIEIICVDDKSTDNCRKILNEYSKNDKRIKVIHHKKNLGVSSARNSGIELATGKYILFVDSDDYLELNTCEQLYEYAEKNHTDIINFGFRQFDDGQDNQINKFDASDLKVITNKEYIHDKEYDKFWIFYFYNSDVIKKNEIRFLNGLKSPEDTCFLFMSLGHAKRIGILTDKFYNYRKRPNSYLTTHKTLKQFWENIIESKMFKKICDFWREGNCLKDRESDLITLIVQWLTRCPKYHLRYAQEILDSFGSDVYNKKNVKKCPDYIKEHIKKLEFSAFSNKNIPLKDGLYRISSAIDNYKSYIDISNEGNLKLSKLNDKKESQTFKISKLDEGYYKIELLSGKILNYHSMLEKVNCKSSILRNYWYIIPCKDGSFNIVSEKNILAIDANDGSNVTCDKISKSDSQKFKFIKIEK